jgi:hypothetical protein
VNVFIARDGVEIAEIPRDWIPDLVRSGEVLPTDHYWHEGMATWGVVGDDLAVPLPIARPAAEPQAEPAGEPEAYAETDSVDDPVAENQRRPKDWRRIGVISLAALVLIAGLATWLIRPDWPGATNPGAASFSGPAPSPPLTYAQVRDRAAAELQQMLDRLPKQAVPPSTTFYYDVSASMNRALSPRRPWTAVIAGSENTINLDTQQTVSRTAFTLNAEYVDGAWTYTSYRAAITDTQSSITTEIEHDAQAPAPPSVVVILRLKTPDYADTSIAITK